MTTFSRRDFIRTAGLAGAGLIISIPSSTRAKGSQMAGPFEPSAYLSIGTDGRIVIFSKNPEIGQGIKTALPQLIAEELEVDWTQIEVKQGVLDPRFGDQFAGGSTGVKTNFMEVRRAGAIAREMLIEAAARKWQASLNACSARSGRVYHTNGSSFSYAELAEAASKLGERESASLKSPKDFKIIGKPIPGVDNLGIVTGKAEFGLDARPPGMLVASILRSPVFGGKVKSVDEAAALKVAGVEKIVRIEPHRNPTWFTAGVAVIARNTWAAMKARKLLKVEWELPEAEPESDGRLREKMLAALQQTGEPLRNDGDVQTAFAGAAKVHEAVFEAPFLAHASMEPQNYIADVRADGADLWGPTQVPESVRNRAAELTGLPHAKINVRMTRVGGGFGRRLMADYACEAIYLSKTIQKPVQVVWTREDDLQHDYYRPAGMFSLKASLDKDNKLSGWDVKATTASRYVFAGSSSPAFRTEIFPDGFPAGFVKNFRMSYASISTKVPRGAWRAPGHNITAWVDQCFIDEMAFLAGKDPVAFRLEILGEEDKVMPYSDHGGPVYSTRRLKNVIRRAAEKSGWRQPAPSGRFRGFAAHFMFGAYVAEVATVSLQGDGAVKVEELLAVVDCGLVINASNAKNQLEGGLIDGLSSAMYQGMHIEGGAAKESNFDDYRLLRMKDAPRIEVELVQSEENPEGLGEMSLPPVAAAVSNAIFAATGKRIRKLPIQGSVNNNL